MFGDVHTKNVPVIVDIALTRFSYMSYVFLQTKKPALGDLLFANKILRAYLLLEMASFTISPSLVGLSAKTVLSGAELSVPLINSARPFSSKS